MFTDAEASVWMIVYARAVAVEVPANLLDADSFAQLLKTFLATPPGRRLRTVSALAAISTDEEWPVVRRVLEVVLLPSDWAWTVTIADQSRSAPGWLEAARTQIAHANALIGQLLRALAQTSRPS
jgi:hypothetical protein